MDNKKTIDHREINKRRERLNQRSENHQHALAGRWMRHTIVRIMRWGLPVIGILLLVLVMIESNPQDNMAIQEAPIFDQTDTDNKQLQRLEMIQPEYHAYDENKNPYTITADRAIKQNEEAGYIILERPKADLMTKDTHKFYLNAQTGDYNQEQASILLKEGVQLESDQGYIVSTQEMKINLKNSSADTDKPTTGNSDRGSFVAQDGVTIEENGMRIILKGPSKVILNEQEN